MDTLWSNLLPDGSQPNRAEELIRHSSRSATEMPGSRIDVRIRTGIKLAAGHELSNCHSTRAVRRRPSAREVAASDAGCTDSPPGCLSMGSVKDATMGVRTDTGEGVVIRPAKKSDLPTLGKLGALLLRTHYAYDSARFMTPPAKSEEGYAWFLGTQLAEPDVVVLVAERNGHVVGYVYAGLEPESWKELRGAAGFIHDVVVDERARRTGVATALIEAANAWLRDHRAPRVMLWTAEQNDGAQRFFGRLGFRRTMIEMTRELDTTTARISTKKR
jgi:GNAT superfamily N-acetyltransferase